MPPLEYLRFVETAKTVLEAHGISVEVVAFTKQGAESGTRARVDAPARSRTLPFYVVDALAAASDETATDGAPATGSNGDGNATNEPGAPPGSSRATARRA
jgi:hypothetical protein